MCFPVAVGWKSLIRSAWAEFAALKCPKLQENMEDGRMLQSELENDPFKLFLLISSQIGSRVAPLKLNSRGPMDVVRLRGGAHISRPLSPPPPPPTAPSLPMHMESSLARYLSGPITAISKSKKSRQFMRKLQRTHMKRSILMRSLSVPRREDKERG